MESREIVQKAKDSFEKVLLNEKYSGIIKNDKHLSLLLEMLSLKPGNVVLDVGTGAGYLAFPIAQGNRNCKVIGLDIAEKVIEQNQKKAEAERIDNIRFCSFDGVNYPFEKESINVIATRYAFHHFPDVRLAVRQLAGLLCQKGQILISDPVRNTADKKRVIDRFMEIKGDGHVGFYTQEEILTFFDAYGVKLLRTEMTDMKFPFPKKPEYLELFGVLKDEEKAMYHMYEEDGTVWVGNISVANMLLEKVN